MSNGEMLLSDAAVAGEYTSKSVEILRFMDGLSEAQALDWIAEETSLGFWTCWGLFRGKRKTARSHEIGRLKSAYLTLCKIAIARLQESVEAAGVEGTDDERVGQEMSDLRDISSKLQALAREVEARLESS